MTAFIFFGILIAAGVAFILAYNGLVRLRNAMKNAFLQIDVQLKRRYDLIPNLVETAKAYMAHERETLEAVIAARNQAATAERRLAADPSDGAAMKSSAMAEGLLSGVLSRFVALVEDYPDLKADKNMQQLSEELTATENKVAFARQAFNDAVMLYNNQREEFPSNLVAGLFSFAPAAPYEFIQEPERAAPKVVF
jgi:LemA protein